MNTNFQLKSKPLQQSCTSLSTTSPNECDRLLIASAQHISTQTFSRNSDNSLIMLQLPKLMECIKHNIIIIISKVSALEIDRHDNETMVVSAGT